MDIGRHLTKALEFRTAFTVSLFGFEIPVSETVIVSWLAMAVLIVFSLIVTRSLREKPRGFQVLLEAGIGFLDSFSREQFGRRSRAFAPYIGTIFLFLLTVNIIPVISPIAAFGYEPPFTIKPPGRDINFTAALAILSILIVLFSGLKARGFKGWCVNLLHPVPLMLPFNLLEYIIRPLSLCLRLYGNILGGFIIMMLIEAVFPLVLPVALSLYFDFLDGLIQALVFSFLTTLFIAEAIEVHGGVS
ncbi:MAG: F0F1 ATP synthase subunit A [Spirochaetaceae bacterium]|jgi:F-type H+-transporting ATPase subunit a|nr:F0F1 ATP synthase subunit A [Spirochaetaceae bacterium]